MNDNVPKKNGGKTPLTARSKPPIPSGPLPPTPAGDGGPITDVNTLSVVKPNVAAQIKKAAGLSGVAAPPQAAMQAPAPAAPPAQVDTPGSERWPVKTGQDPDRAKVGKNVIGGKDLGAGIVETTVEELVSLPRPAGTARCHQRSAGVQERSRWSRGSHDLEDSSLDYRFEA